MKDRALRHVVQIAVGVVIAALALQALFVLGWIAPVTVSGSSMAPALLGPHRSYRCRDCGHDFAVGLDRLPPGEFAVCPQCGERRGEATSDDRLGQRLAVDRTAFWWHPPRRWDVVVFRCPENAGALCVKRVIGLPGETIELDDGDVIASGRAVRKSFREQQAVRQAVDVGDDRELHRARLGDVACRVSSRWRVTGSNALEFREPITDELSINQAATPPVNRVPDVMLTFDARLAGTGELVVTAMDDRGRCDVVADFSTGQALLRLDDREIARRPLPAVVTKDGVAAAWTFSLFDRQVLLAVGEEVVLAEPWEPRRVSRAATHGTTLSLAARSLRGEIERVAVWRDAYYAVRHSDGRQPGARQKGVVAWRLGPGEYFVVGDNAAISDDSRSWPAKAGLDAKLLIGNPLGAR